MSQREIKLKIVEKAEEITKSISNGNTVEIEKTPTGVVIHEVKKRKI